MALFEIQQIEGLLPATYLPAVILFALVFFLLSLAKLNLKIRLIIAVVVAIATNFLPMLSAIIVPLTATLGSTITAIVSAILLVIGFIKGGGGVSYKNVMSKAGEPTSGMEKSLAKLERERDSLISQLQHARGDPVKERQIETRINAVNKNINVLKAKLGVPITA